MLKKLHLIRYCVLTLQMKSLRKQKLGLHSRKIECFFKALLSVKSFLIISSEDNRDKNHRKIYIVCFTEHFLFPAD